MSATLELGVPLDNTMGVMFVGIIISGILHGMALIQTHHYYSEYRNDQLSMKIMVGVVMVADFVHLALTTHALYDYLITNYYDPMVLQRLTWSISTEAVFVGINGGLVQIYYAIRVWRLSHNLLLICLIGTLVLIQNAFGLVCVVLALRLKTFQEFLSVTPWAVSLNAVSATIDVVTSASVVVLLHRSRTGLVRSDGMINHLIFFTVNTGVLTSVCAIAALISLIIAPRMLVYSAFYIIIGGLYTNSFLASVNARRTIMHSKEETGLQLTSVECYDLSTVPSIETATTSTCVTPSPT
ncbi:hypothetical protein AX15_002728 [Amanita polypyramis BW_CC]|nr:hypothetical protein AX15_002728 [Amanita polypyramis BW_CC]